MSVTARELGVCLFTKSIVMLIFLLLLSLFYWCKVLRCIYFTLLTMFFPSLALVSPLCTSPSGVKKGW
jgi:hypothetical protein